MNSRQSVLTLGSVYIGTVIGAGFASGQEILQFFGKYGKLGLLGVAVSTLLFCLLGANLLQLVYNRRINSFNDFLKLYFNGQSSLIINCLLTCFLLIGYIVMLAGGGAILTQLFGIDGIYGIIIMSTMSFFTFIFGVKGIAKVNSVIVPLLMILVVIFTIMILHNNTFLFNHFKDQPIDEIKMWITDFINDLEGKTFFTKIYMLIGWLWSSILYVSFNSLVAIVVLTTLYPFIKSRKCGRLGGILGGIGLGVMASLLLINLLFHYTSVHRLEVPMIAVTQSLGVVPRNLYSILLWFAMFTTAIANGFGCIKNVVSFTKAPEGMTRLMICCGSIPLALIGFKRLVTFFYPLFGYMGLLFLILILFGRKK
ncbi:YkvI family membrane protein [Alkaliphilus transvaalensis]|uniref:YkvI family membrane protein n=1 Tax=Alkaliphilus transvaalensis TaxID=114628 RepID=UPI00047EE96F|nr:hypothetical protein [Alkaliphilus transvaalensis]